ncbi:hypothetical protein KJ969_00200 [Patescibacteria group bacterium]|nr:hypothetical protein [Patescibacteria group bacterium]MBU1922275.1 hypothetical protein [Patescibacteria group bacterium]
MHIYDTIHHYFEHFLCREVAELYISTAIRVFGMGMIALFAPIYIFKLGYSIQWVFLFYMLMAAYYMVLIPFVAKIVARIGYEASMGIGIVFLPIFYGLMYFLAQFSWLFWIAPLAAGLYKCFYWLAFHSDFIRFGNRKHLGEEVGWAGIITSLTGIIAPAVGGLVLAYTDFTVLFIVVSIIFLLSLVPLYTTKEVVVKAGFSGKKFFKKIFSRRLRKDFIAILGYGDNIISEVAWPIFLITVVASYISMGLLTTAAILATFFVLLYVGKRANQAKRKKMVRVNSTLLFIAWIARIFSFNGFYVFFTDSFFKISTQSLGTVLTSIFYSRMKKENILYYVAFRDFVLSFSKILAGAACIILFIFTDKIYYAFVLAAFFILLQNFWEDITEKDLKYREF